MIKLKRREQIIAYVLASGIFVFLVIRFFFFGLGTKVRNLTQQIKLQEALLQSNMDIRNRRTQVLEECEKYQAYLRTDENLSDREVIARFLKEIERAAQETGVSIISLNPWNQPEQATGYKTYTADMRAEATQQQLINFLYKIQESKFLLKLNKLSLAPKDEQASSLKVDTNLSLIIPQ